MTAVALLSREKVSVDALDDVRMAVEEAYIRACELGGAGDRITFEFTLTDDRLDVRVGPLTGADMDREEDAADRYSAFILESVCDEYETCEEDEAVFIRISKRLASG
jgi:hypothetical protein